MSQEIGEERKITQKPKAYTDHHHQQEGVEIETEIGIVEDAVIEGIEERRITDRGGMEVAEIIAIHITENEAEKEKSMNIEEVVVKIEGVQLVIVKRGRIGIQARAGARSFTGEADQDLSLVISMNTSEVKEDILRGLCLLLQQLSNPKNLQLLNNR